MRPVRYGRVDPARTRAPYVGDQPAVPVVQEIQRQVDLGPTVNQLLDTDRIHTEAAFQDLLSRGLVTAVERTNYVQMAQAISPPVTVCSFTVPGEMLFRFDHCGFAFSDPIAAQLNSQTYLPWQVEIEGVPIPGFGENNSLAYRVPIGTNFEPWHFEPVWCHANHTIAIVLRTLAAVTIQVNVVGRIGGGLIKKSGLRLGREV